MNCDSMDLSDEVISGEGGINSLKALIRLEYSLYLAAFNVSKANQIRRNTALGKTLGSL